MHLPGVGSLLSANSMRIMATARSTGAPVCARPLASQSSRHRVELVRMSDDSGVDSGVLMLEWRSPGEEEVDLLGSAAGSCKEVGSGRGFYSECYRLFVPDGLTAFMTRHAAAPLTMPPCLLPCLAYGRRGVRLQVARCRPYLCQVGCTTPGVLRTTGRPVTSSWPRQQPRCPRA
ncbi:hypothetical protein GW17_00012832 [Ensete ventricosum]|nr:hypothetical protein GW17_00012832 [Ensete ventricosum]